MRLRRWLGLLLAISTLGLIPATQDLQASPAGSTEDKIAILDGLATVGNSGEDSSGLSVGDLSKYGEGLAVTYNNWTLEYRKSAYRWQYISTVVIFCVVNFVVISGVLMAAWQLRSWLHRVQSYDRLLLNRLANGEPIDRELVESLGRSDGGQVSLQDRALAVSSAYVGVVILGISIGFFLAYLLLVYPITVGP